MLAFVPAKSDAQTEPSIDILFTAERAWLVRKCAMLIRNADAAEDLAQETLLEAWRRQDKLYDRGSEHREECRRWLGAIAHNVCLRWLRKDNHERAHRILPLDATSSAAQEQDEWGLEQFVAPDHYGVELEFERTELSALLNEALAYLSEPLRTALVARYIHGAAHDEITQQLQVNEATLVQRIYRGKQALRTVLTTQLSDELAAYGIYQPGTVTTMPQVTRMWYPWCGNGHLTLHDNGSSDGLLFKCQSCNGPTGGKKTIGNWPKVSSAAARYVQLVHWLHDYYWQAIDQTPSCIFCDASAILDTHEAHELPTRYRD
jgi:RNA polymerase sigma factor (sigma-70 family)